MTPRERTVLDAMATRLAPAGFARRGRVFAQDLGGVVQYVELQHGVDSRAADQAAMRSAVEAVAQRLGATVEEVWPPRKP